uniref:early estrogen-induced gene 1 protein isoform X2 n=2 Tax=Myxine glutinosa TaxID=7769 RepID=UPI00358F4051
MAFMMKKKKYTFGVTFEVEELTHIPFMNAVLFCKLRLLDGGKVSECSSRLEVRDNRVQWRKKIDFVCKMSASATSGLLDPCTCRVSVRKEVKGGKTYTKLGFADLNLAEFAGSRSTTRRCLLEGYDTKHARQDNSILKVVIGTTLLSGDPCFKTPIAPVPITVPGEETAPHLELNSKGLGEEESLSGSLTQRQSKGRPTVLPTGVLDGGMMGKETTFHAGHVRSASSASQHSRISGYSTEHSRASSLSDLTHRRNTSEESGGSTGIGSLSDCINHERVPPPRPPPPHDKYRRKDSVENKLKRFNATRVDADDIIDQILQTQDFMDDTSSEDEGLRLLVKKDGTTALK